MKKGIYVLLIVGAALLVYAFTNTKVDFNSDVENGIQFYKGSWEETLRLAKKENKYIFLDIYATWCGPCKKLKKNTFSDESVGRFYNQNFINMSLDGETEVGNNLMQKYKLKSFPSLLFIDGNGQIVHQTSGYHNPNQLLEVGRIIAEE